MADVQRTSPRQAMETTSVSFITIFALSFLLFSAIAVVGQLLGAQFPSRFAEPHQTQIITRKLRANQGVQCGRNFFSRQKVVAHRHRKR